MTMTTDAGTEPKPKRALKPKTDSKSAERTMSDSHKAALARGREHGRIVRRYLEALESHKPRRGRKRDLTAVADRLAYVEEALPEATALDKLHLIQEKYDLEAALAAEDEDFDITDLEADFIEVGAEYSESKGLRYAAWREAGVEPRVLKAAGIGR